MSGGPAAGQRRKARPASWSWRASIPTSRRARASRRPTSCSPRCAPPRGMARRFMGGVRADLHPHLVRADIPLRAYAGRDDEYLLGVPGLDAFTLGSAAPRRRISGPRVTRFVAALRPMRCCSAASPRSAPNSCAPCAMPARPPASLVVLDDFALICPAGGGMVRTYAAGPVAATRRPPAGAALPRPHAGRDIAARALAPGAARLRRPLRRHKWLPAGPLRRLGARARAHHGDPAGACPRPAGPVRATRPRRRATGSACSAR